MDLIGDLPPVKSNVPSKPKATSRFIQPLRQSTEDTSKVGDLFADLPTSTQKEDIGENNIVKKNEAEKRKLNDATASTSVSPAKRPALELYGFHGTFAERKGEREELQDRHVLIEDLSKQVAQLHPEIARLSFYAVYDGHSGTRAADYASKRLHSTLAEKFPKGDIKRVDGEIRRIFTETYKKTDDDFLKIASKSKPSWKDGSTATTLLLVNNTLYIANLGDSRAILCRHNEKEGKDVAITLTTDHSPSDYSERIRIQKAGGSVRDGRVLGVLEVSRSLGDGPYKRHGVTCVPDIKRCQLGDNDKWVLIACDGLWKSFTNEEALIAVNQILQEKTSSTGEELSLHKRQELACHKLANDAVRRLSADNVTVLLITVKQP